jgi:hypothetical protein
MVNNLPFDVVLHVREYLFQNFFQGDNDFYTLRQMHAALIRTWNSFLSTTSLLTPAKNHCRVIMITKSETMVIRSKALTKILSIIRNPVWQLVLVLPVVERISSRIFRHLSFLTICVTKVTNHKWFNCCEFHRCKFFYVQRPSYLMNSGNGTSQVPFRLYTCLYPVHSIALIYCSDVTDISSLSKVETLKIIGCRNIINGLESLKNVKSFTVDFISLSNYEEQVVNNILMSIP